MSLTIDIDMTESDMEHPTAGRRRRHKSPPTLHAQAALPVPIQGMAPPMRKAKRKQSVRDQSRLLLFLQPAGSHMNTIR